jgi:hypothetical protein
VGRCDFLSGTCRCPAGAKGADCSETHLRGCGNGWAWSPEFPQNLGPKNWEETGWTASRCDGECEPEAGLCYCPAYTK